MTHGDAGFFMAVLYPRSLRKEEEMGPEGEWKRGALKLQLLSQMDVENIYLSV